jgi:hypothetical protein
LWLKEPRDGSSLSNTVTPGPELQRLNATALSNVSSSGAFIEIKIEPETVAAADKQQIQPTAPKISISNMNGRRS